MSQICLDIGSGGPGIYGYIGVDRYAPWAEVQADMWDLPYESGTVDKIYSSHALEHIPKEMVVPTLGEWSRVLKPTGSLELLVPDLAWCLNHWLENQTIGWEMDIIFGHQAHEGEFHKTGFNEPILRQYLVMAGFDVVSVEFISTHSQQTIRALATPVV